MKCEISLNIIKKEYNIDYDPFFNKQKTLIRLSFDDKYFQSLNYINSFSNVGYDYEKRLKNERYLELQHHIHNYLDLLKEEFSSKLLECIENGEEQLNIHLSGKQINDERQN